MPEWTFQSPVFLWGFAFIPFFVRYMFFSRASNSSLSLPSLEPFSDVPPSFLLRQRPLLNIFRLLAFALLLLALARPQKMNLVYQVTDKGIDILLVADVSLSMLAKDFSPDRLSVLKKEALHFVNERKNDRIGLLAFSGEVLVKVPLTFDREILSRELSLLRTQELNGGTALGDALGIAVNHLRHSASKSKIILLMTDGVNNDGFVDPRAAMDLASRYGIKVYTIGIGTNGKALFPARITPATGEIQYERQSVEIDEELLKEIAQKTQGKYFRATDNKRLQEIYQEIDHLDKSLLSRQPQYVYQEYFDRFALAALLFLLLEFFLRATFYKHML